MEDLWTEDWPLLLLDELFTVLPIENGLSLGLLMSIDFPDSDKSFLDFPDSDKSFLSKFLWLIFFSW